VAEQIAGGPAETVLARHNAMLPPTKHKVKTINTSIRYLYGWLPENTSPATRPVIIMVIAGIMSA
jgi:hypothetical protein